MSHGEESHKRETGELGPEAQIHYREYKLLLKDSPNFIGVAKGEDKLRLLRAVRANVSPIFALYPPDGGAAVSLCEAAAPAVPAATTGTERYA